MYFWSRHGGIRRSGTGRRTGKYALLPAYRQAGVPHVFLLVRPKPEAKEGHFIQKSKFHVLTRGFEFPFRILHSKFHIVIMYPLIALLYFIFMVVYALLAVFIVFHLRRYMIHHDVQNIVTMIFVVVTGALFALNILLFLAAPFEGGQSF